MIWAIHDSGRLPESAKIESLPPCTYRKQRSFDNPSWQSQYSVEKIKTMSWKVSAFYFYFVLFAVLFLSARRRWSRTGFLDLLMLLLEHIFNNFKPFGIFEQFKPTDTTWPLSYNVFSLVCRGTHPLIVVHTTSKNSHRTRVVSDRPSLSMIDNWA